MLDACRFSPFSRFPSLTLGLGGSVSQSLDMYPNSGCFGMMGRSDDAWVVVGHGFDLRRECDAGDGADLDRGEEEADVLAKCLRPDRLVRVAPSNCRNGGAEIMRMTSRATPSGQLRKHSALMRASVGLGLAMIGLTLVPTVAAAAESVTYTYDALGRLIRTQRSGGPASGVDAQLQYDPAGNRTNVTVSGASSSSPPVRVIVLPLNGYTVIPLPD